MANTQVINSFNAGELSPYLYARNDLQKYNNGALVLENFTILPYGGVSRRPAIKYISKTKGGSKVLLVNFEFSTAQVYILEFGERYVRFYKDKAKIAVAYAAWGTSTAYLPGALVTESATHYRCLLSHTSGTFATDLSAGKWEATEGATDTAYELRTPYTAAMLPQLRFTQSADVMWITHPNNIPQRLSRYSDTGWSIDDDTLAYNVFLDQNITAKTMTVSALTGTGKTLTASAATFDANHVGSYWQIKHTKNQTAVTAANAAGAGPAVPSGATNALKVNAGERVTLQTNGTWNSGSSLAVWRSDDAGTSWEQYRLFTMFGRNVDTTWTEESNNILFCFTNTTTPGGTVSLSSGEAFSTGVVKITAITSDTVATCDIIAEVGATTATKRWSEGAWSTYRGFPSVCALWESRLIFASTLSNPGSLWLSTIDDYNNFKLTDLDDGAMWITIASGGIDEIKWLVAQRALIIGTAGGEWALEAESDNKPVTPTSFSLKRKTTYGSSAVQGVMVNSAVLFVMRQGRKVREFVYNIDAMDYVAIDLTILAEHITKPRITEMSYQQQPDNVLMCIRSDGVLAPLTYERDQDVTGWQRWLNDEFLFESIAILPKDNDEDEIWASCQIEIGEATERYIGIFDNREWGTNVQTQWNGSDFYMVFTDPASTTISGLDYLEGKEVAVVRDGFALENKTVTDGEITIDKTGARIVVGLPYTSTLAPMYLEPGAQFQQPVGKTKGLFKAILRFKDTVHAKVGQTLDKLETITFRSTSDPLDTQIDLFSGEKKINFENRYAQLHTCYVVQDKPLPITVVAMIPSVEVKG